MLHHVVGEHEWILPYSNSEVNGCRHGPLEDEDLEKYLEKGEPAHEALRSIVMDKRLLNKIPYFLNFRYEYKYVPVNLFYTLGYYFVFHFYNFARIVFTPITDNSTTIQKLHIFFSAHIQLFFLQEHRRTGDIPESHPDVYVKEAVPQTTSLSCPEQIGCCRL